MITPNSDGRSNRAEELNAALLTVRRESTDEEWSAFWACTVQGRTARLVAEECGVAKTTIWQANSALLHRLRELMQK